MSQMYSEPTSNSLHASSKVLAEKKKLRNLSESWDLVMIIDQNKSDDYDYKYRLRCNGLDKILKWC
jgi:hypothetical protein